MEIKVVTNRILSNFSTSLYMDVQKKKKMHLYTLVFKLWTNWNLKNKHTTEKCNLFLHYEVLHISVVQGNTTDSELS